jgi:hypothetical protein
MEIMAYILIFQLLIQFVFIRLDLGRIYDTLKRIENRRRL